MNRHKSKKIALKMIEVDELIIPVVKWLNSFDGVLTLSSCQSYNDEERAKMTEDGYIDILKPTIIFYCEDSKDLIEIFQTVQCFADPVTIQVNYYRGMLRYILEFPNQEVLQHIIEHKLS